MNRRGAELTDRRRWRAGPTRSPRRARRSIAVACALVLCLLSTACSSQQLLDPVLRLDLPLVVVDSASAQRWVEVLHASGVSARVGTISEMFERSAGVVPADADLYDDHLGSIRTWVRRGGRLTTPHRRLLERLGVTATGATGGNGQRATGLDDMITWPSATRAATVRFRADSGATDVSVRQRVVGGGPILGRAVLASARFGAGRVLAVGADPVAGDLLGYELFPLLGREVATLGGVPPAPYRRGVEVYVDPGLLVHGDGSAWSATEIADSLVGVSTVYLAGWNFDFVDPADDFEYEELITALHARGIAASAWLAPPFVNLRTWDERPECRQRTSTGREATVGWRSLLALEIPTCFDAAWHAFQRLLTAHSWDGVNFAELYFEAPKVPDDFTPFSAVALERFGRDPAADPEGFLDFRSELAAEQNDALLAQANGLPGATDLDLVLTVIDDSLDPDVARSVGSDLDLLARVAAVRGAALQIEDPYTQWGMPPSRYDAMDARVAATGARSFADVNVVDRMRTAPDIRSRRRPPTTRMVGGELGLALAKASGNRQRVAVYSAATLWDGDRDRLAAMAAGAAIVSDSGVSAPWTVTVPRPSSRMRSATVDGVAWPSSPRGVVLPPGEHEVAWSTKESAVPSLVSSTIELSEVRASPGRIEVGYSVRSRGWIVVGEAPTSVEVDGEKASLPRVRGPEGWAIRVPGGAHSVAVHSASR